MTEDIRIVVISPEDHAECEAAVKVMQEGYFPHESCCKGVGIMDYPTSKKQASDLVRAVLKEGVSVGLYCGGEMVAVSINKLQVPPHNSYFEKFRDEHATDPRARFLMDFMIILNNKADLFSILGPGKQKMLELMFVSVVPSHRRRGFADLVIRKSIEVAREAGASGACAMCTTLYSRAVCIKTGFKEYAVVENSDFVFEGTPITKSLGPHQQHTYLVMKQL